jgi:hypothetical protein
VPVATLSHDVVSLQRPVHVAGSGEQRPAIYWPMAIAWPVRMAFLSLSFHRVELSAIPSGFLTVC